MADLYSFDREERYLLRRGESNTLEATWSLGGATVTPTPGTVRVRRPGGQEVVSASAFTVSGNVASYTMLGSVTDGLTLEEGWQVLWEDVGFPDGTTRSFVAEAALVRWVIAPPANQRDLWRRVARLNPAHPNPLTLRTVAEGGLDLDDKLRDAWREIERMLYVQGRRPELVMSPAQFRIPHRELALALVFEDLRTSDYEAYHEIAVEYRDRFNSMWDELKFTYDGDNDGLVDGGAEPNRPGPESTTWLTARDGGGSVDTDVF